MSMRSWFRNLFFHRATRTIRKAPHWARLALESLEDRYVPSTLTVTSSADDVTQKHTLRYAVAHSVSGDTIQITAAVKDPIVLTNGELVVNQKVTILSVPSRTATISGDGISRVFEVSSGASVRLQNLNITGGNGLADNLNGTAGDDGLGGALLNLGTLAVSNCTLSGNSANGGGGIFNIGTLTVTGGTISGNSANDGGGINNNGSAATATVTGSTLSGNTAVFGGGGISNAGATLALSGSTLSGNTALAGGGLNTFGVAAVTDCTLSDNAASDIGGGIINGGTLTVSGSKLSGNSASSGGGIATSGSFFSGTLFVDTSHFSGNTPDNIFGGFFDLGGNTGL
jgi:hypothetical protein